MVLQTKQELFDFLRKVYKNDPELEKFLDLTKGKDLPDELDELLRTAWKWENPVQSQDTPDWEYYEQVKPYPYISLNASDSEIAHLLKSKDFLDTDGWCDFINAYYKDIFGNRIKMSRSKAESQNEKAKQVMAKQIKQYLDNFVGDKGCYLLDEYNTGYNIYIFTPNYVALDFMETELDKLSLILS